MSGNPSDPSPDDVSPQALGADEARIASERARQSQRLLGTACIAVGILCLLTGGVCVVAILPGFALGVPLIWGGVLLLQGQTAPWAKPLLIVASLVLGLLVLALLFIIVSLRGPS